MADNLPLLPSKSTVCKDVRPVMRAVFRELDFLPPLATDGTSHRDAQSVGDDDLPPANRWVEQYKSESKEISDHEDNIKDQFAKRIAKGPPPNIYKLHQTEVVKFIPKWRLERGLIDRRDLTPTIVQNAGRDGSLWVQNILNASSCDVSAVKMSTTGVKSSALLTSLGDTATKQSKSIGEQILHQYARPVSTHQPPASPQYIVCLPAQLEFVNCSTRQLHTKSLRFINVSKFECRLSVVPPKRRELDIELSSFRGLVVTPGAAVELKVHFRPTDVRAVKDVVAIRVSCGQSFEVPIECYMQPPLLHISVQGIASSIQLSCEDSSSEVSVSRGVDGDIVDLGSRLVGEVHCSRLVLHCSDPRAVFFVLAEDSWMSWSIDCVSPAGAVGAGPFTWCPARWAGGGAVPAIAWCRAPGALLHVAALRVLSATAVTRPLYLVADAQLYRRDHLTVQAHAKDYDICSDDDPDCEYYVNLGIGFPHRSLSTSVQLDNKSSLLYNYHWKVRPWGICCCWEEQKKSTSSLKSEDNSSDHLCIGATEAKHMSVDDPNYYSKKCENARLVSVKSEHGHILPRSTSTIQIRVCDAGGNLGIQRAVVMLILENIPKASFPQNYDPMIVRTRHLEYTPIPGIQTSSHEVCDVVAAQIEVWWEVVPLQFVLDPPVLSIFYSRRLKYVDVDISSWQLHGSGEAHVRWETPREVDPPPPLYLTTAGCTTSTVRMPLPSLPNDYPDTNVIKMIADNEEWQSKCIVTRQCNLRHPTIRPIKALLGVVAPGSKMKTVFQLSNDTFQNIYYRCEVYRWYGENEPRPACAGRIPCQHCKEITCTCTLIDPRKGTLEDGEIAKIYYNVNAPLHDGCVATLLQSRRCEPDLYSKRGASAVLVAYRVLAPQVTARVLPCLGVNPQCSEGCALDEGAAGSALGTAVLRPRRALVVGRRTCYRLRLTNITPLPTAVHFDAPIDGTEVLRVKFTPNEFNIRSYGEVEVRVVLEALQVCARRIFVYRVLVLRAHRPLYFVVDTEITGVRVSCQVPLGGDVNTDDFIIITRTQGPQERTRYWPSTAIEIFADEDRNRAFVKENICHCPFKMLYIPPVKKAKPPSPEEEYVSLIGIVEKPPPLTRICPCEDCSKPYIRDAPDSISLQFINIPLGKVCERRLTLRNESIMTAQWNTAVRKWPREHVRGIGKARAAANVKIESWCMSARSPGVVVSCSPPRGVLGAQAQVTLSVRVSANCWGLYREQILIQIENVEPIVLDVWIEAIGAPLLLKMQPDTTSEKIPTLWFSTTDPVRSLHIKNESQAELIVHAYVTRQYEWKQDELPFRLYMRFHDLPPIPCPCYTGYDCDVGETSEASLDMEMDTGIEVHLAPDCGPQDNTYYKVSPEARSVRAGDNMKWEIKMRASPHSDLVPDSVLVLRLVPVCRAGEWWYRPDPPPQLVHLRQAMREAKLELSCDDVTVHICALDLPNDDVIRIRKRFIIRNVGNGTLNMSASTTSPWCMLLDRGNSHRGGLSCDVAHSETHRKNNIMITLPPRSSMEMCVEVSISSQEAWPSGESACSYIARHYVATPLEFYDDYLVLKKLPLILDIEYPAIKVNPKVLDFGFVTDGDSRKGYITVSHTSRTNTLQLTTLWVGCDEFEIWPPTLEIPSGGSGKVYIQYTAVCRSGEARGEVHVCARGAGGAWCRGVGAARASPTRDHSVRAPHDHSDGLRPL